MLLEALRQFLILGCSKLTDRKHSKELKSWNIEPTSDIEAGLS